MSSNKLQTIENLNQVIQKAEIDFNKLAKIHGAVTFDREASFALQILKQNDYLADIARGDLDAFKYAILNGAATGISLNPMLKHAYLIGRKKKVCIDFSYLGLIHLAVDGGSVKWVTAEIVFEKDEYINQGVNREPIHKKRPFDLDRGDMVGAYCLAKTHDNEFILTEMPIEEIKAIRDRSESYKAYVKDSSKTTPWETDRNEMIKKTVIRRASKLWPKTNTRDDRFAKAIDVTNDPIDNIPTLETKAIDLHQTENMVHIKTMLQSLNRDPAKFVEHLTRVFNRNLKALEDLTPNEISKAVVILEDILEKQIAKTKKIGSKNETA